MLLKRKNIKVMYDSAENNFGDVLNPVLIKHLCGYDVIDSNAKHCEMLAVGSLLGRFLLHNFVIKSLLRRPVLVWGTGYVEFGQRKYMNFLSRRMHIFAVRGEKTLQKMRTVHGVKFIGTPVLGDPGLLSRELIDSSKISKKYDLGIIPHYQDKDSPLLARIKVKNSKILDIQQSPIDFLHDLAECRAIISSALHGIIASDSLGIPNIRMICGDKIHGGDWKYDDYYSAFGVKNHARINLNDCDFTDSDLPTLKCMPSEKVSDICEQLKQAFPIKIRK